MYFITDPGSSPHKRAELCIVLVDALCLTCNTGFVTEIENKTQYKTIILSCLNIYLQIGAVWADKRPNERIAN